MKMNLVTEYLKSGKTLRKFRQKKDINFHTCYTWVMYTIDKCPIEDLLPWSEKIPDELHVHKKDLEKKAS